ncbi:hypothetical protein FRC01_012590 [Tulasnella sp. 417]|nr:hypothetical protein FRC01_012590 [Tulasnella sp. 417]
MNAYLSSLSISSDRYAAPNMHVLAVGDVPEPDPIPVSTPLAVDPSMAPSLISPLHPPSEPASPSSSTSYESSDDDMGFPGLRVSDDQEDEAIHRITIEDWSSLHGHDQAIPSQSPHLASNSPKIPVSLPLDSPQWTEILATHHPWGSTTTDELVRVVEKDSKRLRYYEVVEMLREYNRQAIIAGLPLAPIPNVNGLKAPLGANDPITSVPQIAALSAAELDAWIEHYGIPLPQENGARSNTRSLLATHLGLVSVFPA